MVRMVILLSCLVGQTVEPAESNDVSPTHTNRQKFSNWLELHFWTDEGVWGGWRIQRHGSLPIHRLWNEQQGERFRGTYEACLVELKKQVPGEPLRRIERPVVVLLHGLVRSRDAMGQLARYLTEKSEFHVINVAYASTHGQVEEHANSLARVVDNLGPVNELNFVTHSMGALVLRRYLHAASGSTRARPHRVVMLAPPNQGSQLARRFRDNPWMRTVWGTSAVEIADWEPLAKQLATPDEFGIIAGGRGAMLGGNPLVDGTDDGVVSIDETRLVGARDFLLLPVSHGSILDSPHVHQSVLRFLKNGFFISEEGRRPVLPPDPKPASASPAQTRSSLPSAGEPDTGLQRQDQESPLAVKPE